MNGAVGRWNEAFDRMDAQLDVVVDSLVDGDLSSLPGFAVPRGLPPLSPICVDRARALLARHRALEAQVVRRLEETQPPAARRRPSVSGTLARTAHFDARG